MYLASDRETLDFNLYLASDRKSLVFYRILLKLSKTNDLYVLADLLRKPRDHATMVPNNS